MVHKQFDWAAEDGTKLYAQCWEPEEAPRAAVCLVHGLGEHSGRYAHVAAALNQAGFALLAFDLRGHGKSTGRRGDLPSADVLLGDIDLLLRQAEARFPGRPRFLYGHSLGGILVLYHALRRRPPLAGVIATAPGLITALHQQRFKVALAQVLGAVLPTLSMASGLENAALSRDPEVIRVYQQDPLVHDRISTRAGSLLLGMTRWVLAHAGEFPDLPLLLVHGGADRISLPQGSIEFARALGDRCTLQVWEGFYHETHNEPEKEEVLRQMIGWLQEHTPA